MSHHEHPSPVFDKAFIEDQKKRLIQLRDELVDIADASAAEEETLQYEAGGEAQEDADSAERMAIQENDEAQYHQNLKRLADVQRALIRIDQGTYGYSEKSGKPIPRARLMEIPETTLTLEEARQEESRA
ncbi:TraR/DksA family transcriptional regulator [Dyella dinghuensis]|uniref:TraR/DksA family transcriptional regulator n=1 Tax=Dyella dinghuensis TaxID=1920169 RepID=A0A3S0WRN2_9GAMM|nr:TraR/DksA family transcriptional regulator [Dyella dinghuensis]RUL66795.1 TraR/DksA family transcriptional regulator [Dyella dinghuensis]